MSNVGLFFDIIKDSAITHYEHSGKKSFLLIFNMKEKVYTGLDKERLIQK